MIATRTLYLLYCTALINDSARKPLEVIRNIPTRYWTVDVSRCFWTLTQRDGFIYWIDIFSFTCIISTQLKRLYDTISVEAPTLTFSGLKFFFISKNMILGVSISLIISINWLDHTSILFIFISKFIGTIVTYEIFLLDDLIDNEQGDICDLVAHWIECRNEHFYI